MAASDEQLAVFFEKELEPGLTNAWTALTLVKSWGFDVRAESLWFGSGRTAKHELGIKAQQLSVESVQDLTTIAVKQQAQFSPETTNDPLRMEATRGLVMTKIAQCAGALVVCGDLVGVGQFVGLFNDFQTFGELPLPPEV